MIISHNYNFNRENGNAACTIESNFTSAPTQNYEFHSIGNVPSQPSPNGQLVIECFVTASQGSENPIIFESINVPNFPPHTPNELRLVIKDWITNNEMYYLAMDHNGNEIGSTDHSSNTGEDEKPINLRQ